MDLVSASVQGGAQTEVSATVGRLSVVGDSGGKFTMETVGGRIGSGRHNTDGSVGLNKGGSINLIGLEAQQDFTDGSSASLAVSAGVTAEASFGLRDRDSDGSNELCAKVGGGMVTVGACIETDTVSNTVRTLAESADSVGDALNSWWQRL